MIDLDDACAFVSVEDSVYFVLKVEQRSEFEAILFITLRWRLLVNNISIMRLIPML